MASLNAKSLGLSELERSARNCMAVVAVVAAVIGLTFEAGLIRTSQDYDRQSWYLVSEHDGFIVTSQLDDEATCRKRENPVAVCRSGSSMMDHGAVRSQ